VWPQFGSAVRTARLLGVSVGRAALERSTAQRRQYIREWLRRVAFDGAGHASCLGQPELYKVFVCSRPAGLTCGAWHQLLATGRNCSSAKREHRCRFQHDAWAWGFSHGAQ